MRAPASSALRYASSAAAKRYRFSNRSTSTMRREMQRGFSLVAAIFLLVVLALMGALIASVTGMQQASGQLDVSGVRAYQSARAGVEWAAYPVLDPAHTLNGGT